MTQFRLITTEEFRTREATRRAGSLRFGEAFPPGTAYHAPWYYDPAKPDPEKVERGRAGLTFLSRWYWTDWAATRPPILVTCPGGSQWCLDQKSGGGGDGWRVVGPIEAPTATPSIVTPTYHGFLVDGVFSPDLEGRA